MKRKVRYLTMASTVGVLLLAVGCGAQGATNQSNTPSKTSSDSGTPVKGGNLTVAVNEEPDNLDPDKTGAAVSDQILQQIGASLVFQNPKTMQYEPYLAKKWSVSSDGLTWTFDLRTDVTYQDGTPLTASDLAGTFQRAMDPKTAGQVAAGDLADVKSVTAPDDHTLVFQLKTPFAPFLADLSDAGYLQPIELSAAKKEGTAYGRHPISVGPWKFDNWVNGQSVTLDRYPGYNWGPSFFKNQGAVYPDKLTYKVISQESTRVAALQTGEVDVANVDPKDVAQFQNNPKFQVYSSLRQGLGLFVMFNMQKPALQDLKVRQAINEAINKQSIIQATQSGQAVKSYGPLPPSISGYDPNTTKYGYHYNADNAKKLLQEAGYTIGSDGYAQKNGKTLSLDLLSMQNGTWDQAAELIQAQLKDIGVKVQIKNLEWPTLLSTATKGQFDMSLMGYTYNDPDVLYLFLDSSQSASGLNFDHLNDPKVDALLQKGRTTIDANQRKAVYVELQKYIVQQAYLAPIYTEKQFLVVNSRVHNLQFYPTSGALYQDVWVSSK